MATAPPTEEDFNNAFNSFSSDVPPSDSIPLPTEPAEGDPAPAAEPAPSGDPTPEPAPAAAPEPAPAEPTPGEPAPAAPEPVPAPAAPAPDGDAILEGLKRLVGTPPVAAPATAAPEPAPASPAFTEEEQQFLSTYEQDWSDVSKGEALKRRAEYGQLVGHVFKEVLAFIKPLQDTTELLAQRTYMGDVNSAIPGYNDQLRQDVTDWVATQPAYLRPAYENVIQQGTVDEVKDLVDRFRGATGQAAAPAAPAPTLTPKAPELSDAAKKAAAALAPVESKRSGVQQPGDPANFDDAWGQFAAPEKV